MYNLQQNFTVYFIALYIFHRLKTVSSIIEEILNEIWKGAIKIMEASCMHSSSLTTVHQSS